MKRFTSMLLAFTLAFGMCGTSVFAAEAEVPADPAQPAAQATDVETTDAEMPAAQTPATEEEEPAVQQEEAEAVQSPAPVMLAAPALKAAPEELQEEEPAQTPENGWYEDPETGDKYYYKNGAYVTGIFSPDGTNNYYAAEDGVVCTTPGIVKTTDGKTVGVRDETGLLASNWKGEINGATYIFRVNCDMLTGMVKYGANYYYADPANGGIVRTTAGLKKTTFGKYVFVKDTTGALAANTMVTYNGRKYIFYSNATGATGIVKYAGKYYFCNPSAAGAIETRVNSYKYGGKYIYVKNSTGELVANQKFSYGGNTYIYLSNATRYMGVIKYGSEYYYCNPARLGIIQKTVGKYKWNGRWYYVKDSSGVLYRNKYIVKGHEVYHATAAAYLHTTPFRQLATSGEYVTMHPNASTALIPWSDYIGMRPCPPAPSNGPCALVDLSDQMLYLYKGGKLVLKTAVVTGKIYGKIYHGTPTGTYYINGYKGTDKVLNGLEDDGKTEYHSHVNYWMPFIGNGYGLHDATWRGSFGGTIYQYNGSHGCVNMPLSAARTAYNTLPVGSMVKIQP